MQKIQLVILFAFLTQISFSQIVNVENKRFYNDSVKFTGKVKFKLIGIKNKVQTLDFGNSVSLQYQNNGNKWLFLGDLNYISVDSVESDNSAFAHLRFNHVLTDIVSFELYTQAQNNKLLNINLRVIGGAGLRFNVLNLEKAKIFYGFSSFFEHQENRVDKIFTDKVRLSTYLSYHFVLGENAEFYNTTYFQPNVVSIGDQRIFNELALSFTITQSFNFEASYFILYDSRHAPGVPETIWRYENKLVINF